MRTVKWTDKNGFLCAAQVRDSDPDDMGPQGIPLCPPEFEVDCEELKRQIHNELVARDVYTWEDVQREQTAITSILKTVLKRIIVTAFREEDIRRRADQRLTEESNGGAVP